MARICVSCGEPIVAGARSRRGAIGEVHEGCFHPAQPPRVEPRETCAMCRGRGHNCAACGGTGFAPDESPEHTWDDIREAALFDPVLQAVVTLVERGDVSREGGLIAATLTLSRENIALRAMKTAALAAVSTLTKS